MEIHAKQNALGARGDRAARKTGRVLLAEDDPELRGLLSMVLILCYLSAKEGFADGSELLEVLADACQAKALDERFDLIISDIRMPGGGGLNMLASLRGVGSHMPVVLITAFGDEAVRHAAANFGALATLDKPFDLDDLRDLVLRVMAQREKT